MNRKTLQELKEELHAIKKNPNGRKPAELEKIAGRLGRAPAKRGKEPNWVRLKDPALSPPLSIPHHKSLSIGVCRSVVNQLLDDCDDWEAYLLEHDE